MLVSHESPICFLERSRAYNDYDYALVHLFETSPEYYSFFKVSKTLGREVLLDNSIFELGKAFDPKKFAKYVEELEPTYYVIPDVLEDCRQTVSSFHKFRMDYAGLPGLKIGVVQGKTYHLLGCSLASEFAHYKSDKSIRSLDTSNPVVAGILNKRYYKDIGLREKPSVLLADLINTELNKEQEKDILYNVGEFKNLIRY